MKKFVAWKLNNNCKIDVFEKIANSKEEFQSICSENKIDYDGIDSIEIKSENVIWEENEGKVNLKRIIK